MRGRLIFPFAASIARLDTVGSAADPDAGGPLASGYDADFREPIVRNVSGVRTTGRKELTPISVPCQIEPEKLEELRLFGQGNSPAMRITLILHYRHLEQNALIDAATGDPLLRLGDRLASINDLRTGALVQAIKNPPGLYATMVEPIAYGIGRRRNLLMIEFADREQGNRSAA